MYVIFRDAILGSVHWIDKNFLTQVEHIEKTLAFKEVPLHTRQLKLLAIAHSVSSKVKVSSLFSNFPT